MTSFYGQYYAMASSSSSQRHGADPPDDIPPSERKKKKPWMEKKRRERINSALDVLKQYVMSAYPNDSRNKLEKAEILEKTVGLVRQLSKRSAFGSEYSHGYMAAYSSFVAYVRSVNIPPDIRQFIIREMRVLLLPPASHCDLQINCISYGLPNTNPPITAQPVMIPNPGVVSPADVNDWYRQTGPVASTSQLKPVNSDNCFQQIDLPRVSPSALIPPTLSSSSGTSPDVAADSESSFGIPQNRGSLDSGTPSRKNAFVKQKNLSLLSGHDDSVLNHGKNYETNMLCTKSYSEKSKRRKEVESFDESALEDCCGKILSTSVEPTRESPPARKVWRPYGI